MVVTRVGATHGGARRSRRLVAALASAIGGVLVLAACTSEAPTSPGQAAEETESAPVASIRISQPDRAVDVSPVEPITVTAQNGRLDEVTMTNPEGGPVSGELAEDGTTWTVTEPLGYGKAYRINATATGDDGRPVTQTSSFTTVTPNTVTFPSMSPLDGDVVGVGQPLAVYFDEPIANKQAAQDAITVNANPPVEGAFYWYSDTEVHYRPREFWAPGTTITMDVNVYGRDLGNGVFGEEDRHAQFTIGDAVIARADGASHTMTVEINGEVVRTMPISMGDPEFPSNNGVHVVTERHNRYTMNSGTFGLDPNNGGYITTVDWATRISSGGEFVHSAPWSLGQQGNTNVSHGCINVSPENARWFHNTVRKGDVVINTNTGGPDLQPWDGFGDWQISWEEWLTGGAV